MALETFLWLRVGLAWGINGQEFTSENPGTEQYIQNMSLYTVISGSHGDEPQVIPPYYLAACCYSLISGQPSP